MLPAADFNFVVCGIATLAATAGYACVRKFRPLPQRALQHPVQSLQHSSQDVLPKSQDEDATIEELVDPPGNAILNDSPDEETQLVEFSLVDEPKSLKRKRLHDHENDPTPGYPHNLKSIYPNKRRSGSVSDEDQTVQDDVSPDLSNILPTTEVPQTESGDRSDPVPSPLELSNILPTTEVPQTESGDQSDPVPSPLALEHVPDAIPIAPSPEFFRVESRFPTPLKRPAFPSNRSKSSTGFANFAGPSSSFYSLSSPATESVPGKPIWAAAVEPRASEVETATLVVDSDVKTHSLLGALVASRASGTATKDTITGEEQEDVILELKGVKLFIKRGEDGFSGGMLGHIKFLSHKTTLAKRLLFRREPLWKVSMNVRMQPTVRCTFDAQENILRVALKEFEEAVEKQDPSPPQTVIYAFKPGRACRKSDFADFAEALLVQVRQGDQS